MVDLSLETSGSYAGLDLTAGLWHARVFDQAAGAPKNETDFYVEASKDLGFATASVGYIWYHFSDSGTGVDDAQEVYFGLSKEIAGISTSLTYFWDIETDNQGYLELGTSNYELTIQNDLGTVDVASFQAPLQTLMLEDAAITVLASGFLDPSMNSNGAGFGLWVSLGTAGGLVPLSNVTGVNEVESISNAGLYPNPTNDNATMFFDLTEGENINLDVVNTMGQRVFTESFGNMTSGTHRVEIPANQMAPGFYFVNLRTNSGVVSTKMQDLR